MLIAYLIGGVIAFLSFSALAEMSVNDPQPGSFRTYARIAFGHRMGFVSGWMYWISGVLIMSSEVTALSIFTRYWFPHVPLWIFAIIYSVLALGINLLGVNNFGKIESLFAIVKISTLVIFILFGVLLLTRIISPNHLSMHPASVFNSESLLPHGVTGLWSSMVFALFSYGGLAIIGISSNELKVKRDVSKAGIGLIIALLFLYVISLFLVVSMVSWTKISQGESPFVTALSTFNIPFIGTIFNIIIISASFSTMVGSFFSITQVLKSLAKDGDAPRILAETNKRQVPTKALFLGVSGLAVSIILSLLLPNTVYEYITTAAGVTLIINWVIIMASQIKNRRNYTLSSRPLTFKMLGAPYSSYIGICLIIISLIGALIPISERIGLLVSLGIIVIIFIVYSIVFHGKTKK
jgi:L-asparagine transporter-like permease